MPEIDTQVNIQNRLKLYKNYVATYEEAIEAAQEQGLAESVEVFRKRRAFYLDRIRELEGNKGA